MRRLKPCTLGFWLGVAALASCGPDEETGRTVHVYLPDDPIGSVGGGGEGGSGGAHVEMHGPPMVNDMTPLTGPYGTEIRISGTDLGSAAREGVTLTLGAQGTGRMLTPTSTPEIVSWSETQIRFRFPFPLSGDVVVTTPEGTATAGTFTPTWDPGPPLDSVSGVKSIASLASAAGRIAAVLDTGPPTFAELDGDSWSTSEIAGSNLRPNTIRLYLDENQELGAFALTTAATPVIAALDPSSDFASTSTGVATAAEFTVTGGPEGGAVWFRKADGWRRAAPTSGTWAADADPIADSRTSEPHYAAGATSDGALVVGWSEDTGDVLDDTGAIFTAMVAPGTKLFGARAKATGDTDDRITGLSFSDRGSGLVATYCGSDVDPLGASDTEFLCWAFLRAGNGGTLPITVKEGDTLRYTFAAGTAGVAYCSSTLGVRLLPELPAGYLAADQFDAAAGETAAWPCQRIVAAEVDSDGAMQIVIEKDGKLYSPHPRQ